MSVKRGQIVFYKRYTREMVKNNPKRVFVFGDNLIGRGNKGQAVIRGLVNTLGLPTKRLPCMDSRKCFFSDKLDEILAVRRVLLTIEEILKSGKSIALPTDGLGTGLAKLRMKSPVIDTYITATLRKYDNRYLKK